MYSGSPVAYIDGPCVWSDQVNSTVHSHPINRQFGAVQLEHVHIPFVYESVVVPVHNRNVLQVEGAPTVQRHFLGLRAIIAIISGPTRDVHMLYYTCPYAGQVRVSQL